MKICTIENCTKPTKARGLCSMHYERQRSGKPEDFVRPVGTQSARYRKPDGSTTPWRYENGYLVRSIYRGGVRYKQLQHRVVYEDYLGRELRPIENVHHINGVRDDNRLENLELWVVKQPAGQRPEDLVIWAKEILALYG